MLGTIRSILILQCTLLFIQRGLAVRPFQTIEEFMQYYFHTNHEEDTPLDLTTESIALTDDGTTIDWVTTSVPTPTIPRTPHPLVNRCCQLGHFIADEVPGSCHLIDNTEFIAKSRNRPWDNNHRQQSSLGNSYAARRHHHVFETCASSLARELRDEFMRCCKARTLPPTDILVTLQVAKPGQRKHHSRYGSKNRRWL
ncbi:uncharacterized protein [Apostichopus japonicus]|uniref:uncharacterized protein n=1 Tax=Stichopus japonicus TaxID=307972 RepID=UPI003AB36945